MKGRWGLLGSLGGCLHRMRGDGDGDGGVEGGFVSKEDQNAVGLTGITDEATLLEDLQSKVTEWFENLPLSTLPESTFLHLVILDGFLLFPSPASTFPSTLKLHTITRSMDLKLFLQCSRTQTIERRTKRSGYVTLEGFWADPEGYVEDVVCGLIIYGIMRGY